MYIYLYTYFILFIYLFSSIGRDSLMPLSVVEIHCWEATASGSFASQCVHVPDSHPATFSRSNLCHLLAKVIKTYVCRLHGLALLLSLS